MKLTKVWIRGFRSIKDQQIFFQNSCQFLIGINESGKSNILRALRLLDPDVMPVAKDRRNPLENEPHDQTKQVHFEFQLSDSELIEFKKSIKADFLLTTNEATLGAYQGKSMALSD